MHTHKQTLWAKTNVGQLTGVGDMETVGQRPGGGIERGTWSVTQVGARKKKRAKKKI